MQRTLFKIFAVLLPLSILAALEGGIRLFSQATFLISVPDEPEHQTVNPAYATRYFRGFRPQVAYNPFLQRKSEDVLRIITLGGSSTAGYPYLFNSGFPERLAVRIRSVDPSRQIEMINIGMTALSSQVLRDMIPHVIQMQPDVVLIYTGHNEYYGAYGIGRSLILTRILFGLKKSILFRGLERIILPPVQSNRTMMAQSARDISIVLGDPTYHTGIQNFEKNMEAILGALEREGIQTYVGTLVSNLRGQPPLGADLGAHELWTRGTGYWADGDTAAALEAFMSAKEYDPVRFRAPQAMNDVLRRTARDHGAHVVDIESYFLAGTSDSLFTDHLHPTALGYDLMAHAFFDAMGYQGWDMGAPVPSAFDAAYARLLIARLRLGFPFREEWVQEEEELRQFERVLEIHQKSGNTADSLAAISVRQQLPVYEALLEAYEQDIARLDTMQAMAHMRSLLYWQPFNERLHLRAAELASEQSTNLSGEVLQLVASRYPSDLYWNTLAALRLRQGALQVSGVLLRMVESAYPESPVMLYNMARYLVLTGDTLAAAVYFRSYQNVARSD